MCVREGSLFRRWMQRGEERGVPDGTGLDGTGAGMVERERENQMEYYTSTCML